MATAPISSSDNAAPDYFQTLADGAPVMIWLSGLDMGCFYFNRAWLGYRGRTLAQESGNGWAEGVHPDDLQRCVDHYVSCFERRLAFAMSYRLQDRFGEYRWILDRGAPHSLPDGTFLGFFGGCALLRDEALGRHGQLGVAIPRMREFARRIATEPVGTLRALASTTEVSLARSARDLRESHTARYRRASGEMQALAEDMAAFQDMARGDCQPALK
jgi:hypothetical protein